MRITAGGSPGSGGDNRVRLPRPSAATAGRAHGAGSANRPGRTADDSGHSAPASPASRPPGGLHRSRLAEMACGSRCLGRRARPRPPRPHPWRAAGRGLTSGSYGRRPCRHRVPKRGRLRTQPRVDRCAGPRWLDWPWLLARSLPVRQRASRGSPPRPWCLPDGDPGRRPGSFSPSGQSSHGRIRQAGKVEARGFLDHRCGVLSGRG
jgi:hypothetical protein